MNFPHYARDRHPALRAVPVLLYFALFTVTAALRASSDSAWSVRSWQPDDGLPGNAITGIAQTPDGYLWVTTPTTLARFDGVRFESYSSKQIGLGPSERFRSVITSKAGGLWLAMESGMVAYLERGKVTNFANLLPHLAIDAISEDGEGAVWITYSKVQKHPLEHEMVCRLKDGKVETFSTENGLPQNRSYFTSDLKGIPWFLSDGVIGKFENGKFENVVTIQNMSSRITPAADGGFWICNGPRLLKYVEGTEPERRAWLQGRIPNIRPTTMLEDREGGIWIGSSTAGLFRSDGQKVESVPTWHRVISCLFEDREGNIWAGSTDSGLSRIRMRTVRVEGGEADSIFERVQSLCEDHAGTLWGATQDGFLVQRIGNSWKRVFDDSFFHGAMVTCVAADPKDGIWIGLNRQRLVHWKTEGADVWEENEGLKIQGIRMLLVSSTGDVWICGDKPNAVQCLRDGKFHDVALPKGTDHLRAIAEDREGDIWIGAARGMLLRAANHELKANRVNLGVGHQILYLFPTADGCLWIAAKEGGLTRLKDGQISKVTHEHELFEGGISQMVLDRRNYVWFGGDRGVYKIALSDLNAAADGKRTRVRFTHYGKGEGLPSLQAEADYFPSAVRRRNGQILMPMRTALAIVDPKKTNDILEKPPVFLTRVTMDEHPLPYFTGTFSDYNRPVSTKKEEITKLYPNYRKLNFEFTALSFRAPEDVRFRYRLEGFDEHWIDAGSRRSATYTRLPVGHYRFRVNACNSDGVWNETGDAIAFSVVPFMWQRWWFQLWMLSLFSAGLVATVRYVSFRRLQTKVRALEQQTALERERTRIAKDLHDDLGSGLTKIVLLGQLTQQRCSSEPEKAGDSAMLLASTARQIILALDETVWAVNPSNDNLPHLVNYLGKVATDFLQTAGIRCRVDLLEQPPHDSVSAEIRHNVFLATKEALNNIVRHAKATEVWLRTAVDEDCVTISIEDNGSGFASLENDADADGLRNMRSRMEAIGGSFGVTSRPGSGTCIALTFPRTASDS